MLQRSTRHTAHSTRHAAQGAGRWEVGKPGLGLAPRRTDLPFVLFVLFVVQVIQVVFGLKCVLGLALRRNR